jgi:adenine-specific DNA-methyltransferase
MNKEQLRELLHEEYKTENWKKITEFVFPNVQILQRPQDIPYNNDKVDSFKQIGNVKLNDGKNLAMFEVKVNPQVNLAGNRVELRKLVAPLIDQERNHGVLVIYEQGKEDYRFTFTAKSTEFDEEKGDFYNRETDARRFTYILGKNESCKTAAERFYQLAERKDRADIRAVEDAFSVEKLSKQFFKEYKEHYEKFVAYLMARPAYYATTFKGDDKAVRDFVKLLLGRLVFIQFVQKKRWLGVPAGSTAWNTGDPGFLYNSFKAFPEKEIFYSAFLEPLFYNTLNKPKRDNDLFAITGTKVPYLNGGLFEMGEHNTSLINFPAAYFQDLLEFFDRYNFTINEYDPGEHEVGIDPEMLGSIFENLLEDNKDKGAFYTPKEIVHYMCQESLIEYLKTYLQNNKVWPEDEESATDTEANLRALVTKKMAGELINDYDELLAKALKEVKICDPAIGSGAFPMGLLNEIYQCVYVLFQASPDVVGDVWDMSDWAPDVVKKSIIQNSIYGVDIEKGAVEIARLRFWLSLIIDIDEKEPHALPNLDYKIVAGNSLVSKLEDDVIDIDWGLNDLSGGLFRADLVEKKKQILQQISSEQKDFFNPDSDKKKLAADIRNLKIDLLINQLELMVSTTQQETQPKATSYKDKKKFVKATELYHKTLGWKEAIARLQFLKAHPEEPLHFFDWKLDFPEVLNELINPNPGFDIVIGNPPYIQLQKMGKEADILKAAGYETFIRTGDIYMLFYEQGHKYLKAKGNLIYITGSAWLRSNYGKELRKFFLNHTNGKILIDLSDAEVFESATVLTTILLFTKEPNAHNLKALRLTKKNQAIIKDLPGKFEVLHTVLKALDESAWVIADTYKQHIKQKVSKQGRKLKNWNIEINYGIKTGLNEAFVINEETKNELITADPKSAEIIKPLLRGRDLGRYSYKKTNLWLIGTFPTLNLDINKYPAITQHLLSFDKSKLEQSGATGSRKKTGNEWFETQDQIGYWKNFEKPKIIYPNMVKDISFTYDDEGYYTNQKCFILTGEHLKYLLGFLNSKLFRYCFEDEFPELQGNSRELNKVVFEQIPVKAPTEKIETLLEELTSNILLLKKQGQDSQELEHQIDLLIYRLYDLNYDEVKAIDPEFPLTEEEYNAIEIA